MSTGRKVFSGPVEATAIGNLLLQVLVAGEVKSLQHLHSIVAYSFPIKVFQPRKRLLWDMAAQRFAELDVFI